MQQYFDDPAYWIERPANTRSMAKAKAYELMREILMSLSNACDRIALRDHARLANRQEDANQSAKRDGKDAK
jgi:hypothetical protein